MRDHPDSFYTGQLAKDIADDIKRVNGNVTRDDLEKYKTKTREPYKSELSGMNMYLTPPPTSGAVLALILNILKGGCCSPNIFLTQFDPRLQDSEEIINIKSDKKAEQ